MLFPSPLRSTKQYRELCVALGSALAKCSRITAAAPNAYSVNTEAEALEEASLASFRLMRYLQKGMEEL